MGNTEFFKELNTSGKFSVLDSIPILRVSKDGIIQSINHKYIKVYHFSDVSFMLQDNNVKRELLNTYKKILSLASETDRVSFLLHNKKVSIQDSILYKTYDTDTDITSKLKEAVNQNITKNVDNDNNTYILHKYLVYEVYAKNESEARDIFSQIEGLYEAELLRLDNSYIKSLTRDEIYEFMYYVYNKNDDKDKRIYKKYLNEEYRESRNISVKELIAPSSYEVYDKELKLSENYYRGLYLYNNYKSVSVSALDNIMSSKFEVITCIKMKKLDIKDAIKKAETELGNVDGEIYKIQSELMKQGLSADLLPRNIVHRKEEAVYINDSLKRRDENLFDVSVYMMVIDSDKKKLNENVKKLISTSAVSGLYMQVGTHMQENIFNSIMPFGVNQTPYIKTFDTESLCALCILKSKDCLNSSGEYYGVNKLSGSPIIYDIMDSDNYSSLILGTSGKGKSFKAKEIMIYKMLKSEKRSIMIIDPEQEWSDIVKSLGGEVIDVKSGGNSHINLFDIDLSYGDNEISDKEDFILSVCSEMMHKPITASQRTTISEAVSIIYSKWSVSHKIEDVPTIEDFAKVLRDIVKVSNYREDKELLRAIEYYSDMSQCTLFRGKSSIDFNNSLISFNLSKLGKDLKTLAMEVICDTIWLRICKNKKSKVPTDIIIDEFHLMFQTPDTATWMSKYYKQLRKYKGCPMGITQNPEDLLRSIEGRNVLNNTNMTILLSMLENDRKLIKDIKTLSSEEIKYITSVKAGEGLLLLSNGKGLSSELHIPFRNQYEKSSLVYKLINTTYDEE